jgi:hypothetical protein
MYACSPHWDADWLTLDDADAILTQLAPSIIPASPRGGRIGLNEGLHFTGGEPFLDFERLLALTELATEIGYPSTFVETNGFWATDDESAEQKLRSLQDAGLAGIMISANPFVLEHVAFERTERAVRVARAVFGAANAIVYQGVFFDLFRQLHIQERLAFGDYLAKAGQTLRHAELLPNGRLPFALEPLFPETAVERFYGQHCRGELLRDWHVHVDNAGRFIPGYCGGLSWGDARQLSGICDGDGVDLEARPVLQALLTDLRALVDLGRDHGYRPTHSYASKCHLCADVRAHLAQHGDFAELAPLAFYERLGDGPAPPISGGD